MKIKETTEKDEGVDKGSEGEKLFAPDHPPHFPQKNSKKQKEHWRNRILSVSSAYPPPFPLPPHILPFFKGGKVRARHTH